MAEDIRNMESTKGIREFEWQYKKPYCIVLDSAYCSMGRMIGYKACGLSGYSYYDATILLELVPEEGLTKDDVDAYEKKLRKSGLTKEEIIRDPEYIRISHAFTKALDIALQKGPCLLHDRYCKEEILSRGYSCLSAYTFAHDMKAKIVKARTSPLYKDVTDDEEVIRGIQEEDNIRRNYHMTHSDTVWGDVGTYDIAINTDAFGLDYSAKILASVMKD